MAFERWASEQGLGPREARRRLMEMAAPAMAEDAPMPEAPGLRRARAAQSRRGKLEGGRKDVEELCAFVERAGRLPPRLKDVFQLCIVEGLSRKECGERLGISPETVRVHLRRLRLLMRARG